MQYSFLTTPTIENIHQILSLYKLEGWWVASHDDADLVKRIVAGSQVGASARRSSGDCWSG
ncbi:MAG: hypothetical protein JRI93_12950 [Deltaproteobacteria bacterium]|nr:hypothetical protein [Deltaproteobacteria bacterium]